MDWCKKTTWLWLQLTNVTSGWIRILLAGAAYYHTYRIAGDVSNLPKTRAELLPDDIFEGAAITYEIKQQGKKYVVEGSGFVGLDSGDAIDIYIYCEGEDGLIRADL